MVERTDNGTAYEVSGPPGAPAVVLIHGLGLNRRIWQWHEPELSSKYHVVRYDLYGHGDSMPPPEKPSLSVFAGQLRDLLEHLSIDACVPVGFSLGGMINRRFALDHAARTRALVIFNSPHERGAQAQRLVEERAAQVADGGSDATIESAIERWFTPEFRAERSDVIDLVRQWRKTNDPVSYPQSCEVLATGVLELINPQPPITLPTLVMTGEYDSGSTPAMAQGIAVEIAGAKTIIVPGLRHMGLVEKPALFTAPLLTFLEDVGITS